MSAGDAFIDSIAAAVAKVLRPVVQEAVQEALADAQRDSTGPQLLRLDQVAERLGCSTRQVQKHIARGHLKTVKLGGQGRPMVRLDELERFIDASEG